MTVICVTGHRPNKLYGYNLKDKRYQDLKVKLKELLVTRNCTEAVTGMALGADTIFAIAVLELKAEGYPIKLHCAVPCLNQTNKWLKSSVVIYNRILSQADIVKVVSEVEYTSWVMDKRNEYMVDISDEVISVWDGSPGGTANCTRYAKRKKKLIHQLKP